MSKQAYRTTHQIYADVLAEADTGERSGILGRIPKVLRHCRVLWLGIVTFFYLSSFAELTKIVNVAIKDDGELVEIETDRDDSYHYIWLNAEDLADIASFAEHL